MSADAFAAFEEVGLENDAAVSSAGLRFRDTVLALGTGGVSISTLQLAKMAGAEVIITSSNDEKLARAKELGATHGINYTNNEKWFKDVKKLTGGKGVDHVVEVGGVGTLDNSLKSTRMGGHVSMVGILSGGQAPVNVTNILMNDIRLQGVFVGPRKCFEDLNKALAHHQIKPVVDKTFAYKDAVEAMEYVASGSHFGKVVITVND